MENFISALLLGVALGLVALAGPLAAAVRRGELAAKYLELLRDCRADRDVTRQQLRIMRAERDYWLSKAKALLLPEVE